MREVRVWVRTDGSDFSKLGASVLEKLINLKIPVKAITLTPMAQFHGPTFAKCGPAFAFVQADTNPVNIVVGTITEYVSRRTKDGANVYVGPPSDFPDDGIHTSPEEWEDAGKVLDLMTVCGVTPWATVPLHEGVPMAQVIQAYETTEQALLSKKKV